MVASVPAGGPAVQRAADAMHAVPDAQHAVQSQSVTQGRDMIQIHFCLVNI